MAQLALSTVLHLGFDGVGWMFMNDIAHLALCHPTFLGDPVVRHLLAEMQVDIHRWGCVLDERAEDWFIHRRWIKGNRLSSESGSQESLSETSHASIPSSDDGNLFLGGSWRDICMHCNHNPVCPFLHTECWECFQEH